MPGWDLLRLPLFEFGATAVCLVGLWIVVQVRANHANRADRQLEEWFIGECSKLTDEFSKIRADQAVEIAALAELEAAAQRVISEHEQGP